MSWPHPIIFWFPWVLHFHIKWYMCTSFLVFSFVPLLENIGFCKEINHAVHKKAQLLTQLYNRTKKRESGFKQFPCLWCSVSEWTNGRDVRPLFGCSLSWLCSHKKIGSKEETPAEVAGWQYCIANVFLFFVFFCTKWIGSVLKTAGETQEDRDFVACIAENDKLKQFMNWMPINKHRPNWSYFKYKNGDNRLYVDRVYMYIKWPQEQDDLTHIAERS